MVACACPQHTWWSPKAAASLLGPWLPGGVLDPFMCCAFLRSHVSLVRMLYLGLLHPGATQPPETVLTSAVPCGRCHRATGRSCLALIRGAAS